ncbi:tetratricopeptide repeat (TPR)-containing protein [Rhynchospora pubera]|uniref:Tetratricopeptide repeat (TPR)-containing protein n=1 Tax=Rhynchospora pubera TaxID=906938 RepID=A0AAV8EDB3_9POAL|nr:tetratricopeptide repeat (TPR)-containing protein [Rhynchospora pubera]
MALTLTTFTPFSPLLTRAKRERKATTIHASSTSASTEKVEIRVCVNRTCARQGSRETLLTLSGLAPPGLSVNSCGCLGRCGAGPNVVVLPKGELVGHCGTPARAAEVLAWMCGPSFDPGTNLEALGLRKRAELALEKGNEAEAVALLSQAIELNPSGGLHVLYHTRSAAKLAMGDNAGALLEAKEACNVDPKFPQGYISQGDAFLAMEEYNSAEEAYATALDLDPSIRRSRSFKARVTKLQGKLMAANASS